MHTTAIRSARSFEIFDDRTPSPWRIRLRSILSSRRHRKNDGSEHESLYQLNDRLLADVWLYREHGIHNLENRSDQQRGSPVPVALLAMWMPSV